MDQILGHPVAAAAQRDATPASPIKASQMMQMVAMMAEMNAFIIAVKVSYPTVSNSGATNTTKTPAKESMRSKEPV